jgi:hypothetical protein
MGAGRIWVGFIASLVVTALLVVPAGASAKPGYVTFPGDHRIELSLKGSHGYVVELVERPGRHVFELIAYKGPNVVIYLLLHAHERGDGIEARLPGVGRVALEFQPAGPAQREPGFFAPQCHGGGTVKQPGYFVGTIRFRGERGYTAVHTTRAKGSNVTTKKEICKRSMFNDNPEPETEEATRLFAYSRSRGRLVQFSGRTLSDPFDPSTFFSGSLTERREGMVIFRQSAASGTEHDLSPGDSGDFPPSATVTPPDPFLGSAVFQRMPGGGNSWTGSLSVDLPGAGRVAMAGPGFSARLCQASGCRRHQSRQAQMSRSSALQGSSGRTASVEISTWQPGQQ